MKIVAVVGSPRKHKMTDTFVKKIEESLQKLEPVEWEYLYLVDYNLPLCAGCMNCIIKGEQSCKDAKILAPILEKLQAADGFILASPSYVDNVTGLMKNFIDHMSYWVHRPVLTDKYAMVVTVTLGSGAKDVASYLEKTLIKMGVAVVGTYPITISFFEDAKEQPKIDSLSRTFIQALKTKPLPRISFNSLVYFKILQIMTEVQKSQGYLKDYEFWQKQGWLNASYFRPAAIGKVKESFANMIQKMVRGSVIKTLAKREKLHLRNYNLEVLRDS